MTLACSAPAKPGPADGRGNERFEEGRASTAARPDEQSPLQAAPAPDAAPAKRGPVAERAQLLREAADQLDRAQGALDNGNKNLAEQLFSTAELLVGPDVLAA